MDLTLLRNLGCHRANVIHVTLNLRDQCLETVVDLLATQALHKLQADRSAVDLFAVVVEQVTLDADFVDISKMRIATDTDGSPIPTLARWQQSPAGVDTLGGNLLPGYE